MTDPSDAPFPSRGPRDAASELLAQVGAIHRTVNAIDVRCARVEEQLAQHRRTAETILELREWFADEIRRVETDARLSRERAIVEIDNRAERDRADFAARLLAEHDKVLTLRTQAIGIAALVAFLVPLGMALMHR